MIFEDEISKEVLTSAKLLQDIKLNALIIGNIGVGKKTLAKYISPKAKIFQAKTLQDDIKDGILNIKEKEIIVENIEDISNIKLFLEYIEKNQLKIIALSKKEKLNKNIYKLFQIKIKLEDLIHRPKDSKVLINRFSKEVSKNLNLDLLDNSKLKIDLSQNTQSLKKSIYFSYFFNSIEDKEILNLFENYIEKKLDENKSYKELLKILEIPMIKIANKKYKSQVQVAKNLGINRITLRKKIELYKEDL